MTLIDGVINPALRPLDHPIGEDAETVPEFTIDPAAFHDVFAADVPACLTPYRVTRT